MAEMDDEMDVDDEVIDLVKTMTGQCEKFVVDHLDMMEKKIETTVCERCDGKVKAVRDSLGESLREKETVIEQNRQEIERLKAMVELLTQREVCKCKELFEKIMSVGQLVLANEQLLILDSNSAIPVQPAVGADDAPLDEQVEQEEQGQQVAQEARDAEQAADAQGQQVAQEVREAEQAADAIRIVDDDEATGGIADTCYLTIDEVPNDLRGRIEGYHSRRSVYAINEKLTDLQRAFLKYFLDTQLNEKSTAAEKTNACIEQGIKYRIWSPNFRPSGVTDFHSYLKQRIKNYTTRQKISSLKSEAETQQMRLEDLLANKRRKSDHV